MTDPGIILFGKRIRLPEHTLVTPHVFDERKDESDEEGMSENTPTTYGDPANLQSRSLKKPDKILPCPRCESMNTKFCYFNNSNINQPRHFCKSCQRYWTAGGTMRNMLVGAGRRKKKNPNCRYIISQESFESEKVISFAENSPTFGASGKENREEDNNGFQFHSHFRWIPIPIPPVYTTGFPHGPIYPSPYWNSVSWLPPNSILGKHSTDGEESEPNGSNDEFKKQRNSILIPKTLRIHDPDEAAKSSIWATLGIKNEHSGRSDLFQAFQSKGNEQKKNNETEPSAVLQANPAAFSRSIRFQERA